MTGHLNGFCQNLADEAGSLVRRVAAQPLRSDRFLGELLRYLFVCMLMIAANQPETAFAAQTPGAEGYVGVVLADMPTGQASVYGVRGQVVVASAVLPEGPAFKAGLRQGDAIITVDRKRVSSSQEAFNLLKMHRVGEQTLIGLIHLQEDGRRLEIEIAVMVEPKPPDYGAQANVNVSNAQQQPVNARTNPRETSMATRPPLQTHQGQYFRWSVPTGWNARESTSGVEMSSPDGLLKVDWAILLRSQGSSRPENFILMMLPKVPGYSNVRLIKVLGHRQQPSIYPGLPWDVAEMDIAYQYRGTPMRSTWTCGILNVHGRTYDATLSGYGAPEGQFDQAKLWLWQVANSVTITNPRQVAGNDTLITPKNNPLDNRGLIESWRQKGLSEDRISQGRREGTMGYERMKDTTTGQKWNMPLESYDGAAGGYRNPNRPNEILQKAQPGE